MMSGTNIAHCRLCAISKPVNKLIDLNSDEEKRCKVLEKLTKLNIQVLNLGLSKDILPKTVCLLCMSLLEKAFDFAVNIERAQLMLNDLNLFRNIKKEDTYEEEYLKAIIEPYVESTIKDEKEFVSKNSTHNVDENKCLAHKKKVKSISLDAIPLAQLKLSWKDYSWLCAYCDNQFPSIDDLKNHSIQTHGCCNAYRCTDCNRRKFKLDNFIIHVKRHRKFLKLSCYKCHIKFPRVTDMKTHKTTHIHSEYKCSGCNETFPDIDQLNKHSDTYNKDKKARPLPPDIESSNLTCVLCDKTFKYKSSLNTHLLIHTDRKRDHTCDKCGKCFLNKHNLSGHMMLHEDARPHQCEICKFRFRTPVQLRSHISIHDGFKPFACEQCGRRFRLRKQLNSHSIIHTDSLPYACTFCNKSFRFKTILNQHLRQHTGVKPYSCEICERDFTNWPNYNKHMKRRHSMDMAKKKHTPAGVFPVNPATGEVIMQPETHQMKQWKSEILKAAKGPGRPKINSNKSEIEH